LFAPERRRGRQTARNAEPSEDRQPWQIALDSINPNPTDPRDAQDFNEEAAWQGHSWHEPNGRSDWTEDSSDGRRRNPPYRRWT